MSYNRERSSSFHLLRVFVVSSPPRLVMTSCSKMSYAIVRNKVGRNHLPVSAALAASAASAAALFLASEAGDNDKYVADDTLLPQRRSDNGIRMAEGIICPSYSMLWNYQQHCSCEGLVSYNRQQTMRWLDNTSTKASLQSKYKVRKTLGNINNIVASRVHSLLITIYVCCIALNLKD